MYALRTKKDPTLYFAKIVVSAVQARGRTQHLEKHLARKGLKEGRFNCHNCNEEYGSLGELKRHLDEEHDKLKRWTCD